MKKIKYVLTYIAIISPFFLYSQISVREVNNGLQLMSDAFGRPLYTHSEYRAEGSPFLIDKYCLANIELGNHKTYRDIPIKINLLTNKIIYTTYDNKEFEAIIPIKTIELFDCSSEGLTENMIFQSGFPKIDQQTEESFYQVLASGKISLLKHYKVISVDEQPYASASIIRRFEKKEILYVYTNEQKILQLNKVENNILDLLEKKRDNIKEFVRKSNLKYKKESDLTQIFNYYNSLF